MYCTQTRLTCSIHSFPMMILCTLQFMFCQEYASLCLSIPHHNNNNQSTCSNASSVVDYSNHFNPLMPTVAMWVQLQSIL